MDYRGNNPGGGGGGGNKKRSQQQANQKQQSQSSSSSRYNVTPSPQDQMNQLLLQQYFLQEQERSGGASSSSNMAAAQAAAAAALFGVLGGGGSDKNNLAAAQQHQQQISELFAAAAAASQQQPQHHHYQQQQQPTRSSSNTPSPSPRNSSPHHPHHQRPSSNNSSSSAAATAAALQQLTAAAAAAAALQQQTPQTQPSKKDSATAALAAQQQWMYLDYLQRIQEQAQAQQAQQQQPKQRGKQKGSTQPTRKSTPQQQTNQQPRQQPQQKHLQRSNNSTPDLSRLFEQFETQRTPPPQPQPSSSLLKSSVLASAKLPADTEIIVQKNNNRGSGGNSNQSLLNQLKSLSNPPPQQQQQPNKRGPKPKVQQQSISSEQAKFEQQLINLGNNNAITITPANLDTKGGLNLGRDSSGGGVAHLHQSPITITPASVVNNSGGGGGRGGGSPPPAHSTPFRYGNDKRDTKPPDQDEVATEAHKYVKELYTHVIPRKPQIGLIGAPSHSNSTTRKSANKQQNNKQPQFRHHRPWIIDQQQQQPDYNNSSTPPPLNLNLTKEDVKKQRGYGIQPKAHAPPEPIIISPPDYSIPIKDGWKREMILKNFDLNDENLSLACEITYIHPDGGKVYSSLNEIKKSNIPDPKNFTFNAKIQLGKFVLPVSENCAKRFEYDELVEYFHLRKRQEVVKKLNLRMRVEHSNYVKLIESYRKNKRKLSKLGDGGNKNKHEGLLSGFGISRSGAVNEFDELLEDSANVLPRIRKIKGKKLNPKTFANLLQIHEFLHTFGETLGFDSESLPSLGSLQKAFLHVEDNEEELVSVLCHLLVCAVEDPGLPNPTGVKHLTPFGQTLKQADVTFGSMSEILRIYLNGISDSEPEAEEYAGWLEGGPFSAQSAYRKSVVVKFICDLLLQNKAVLKYLEVCSEEIHNCKKEKQQNEIRVRKLRMLISRKQVVASILEDGEGGGSSRERGGEDTNGNKGSSCMEELVSAGEDSIMQGEDEKPTPKDPKDPGYAAVASVADSISNDPDSKLSIEELEAKVQNLGSTNEKLKKQMQDNSKSIRSVCLGQDRWRRRYWNLHFGGGVYVEGGETGEFEELRGLVKEKFEKCPEEEEEEDDEEDRVRSKQPEVKKNNEEDEDGVAMDVDEKIKTDDDEEGVVVVKKEVVVDEEGEDKLSDEQKREVQNHNDGVNNKQQPVVTAFTVPPPVIKIFGFGPRVACSGKVMEPEDSDNKLSDDQLLVKYVKRGDWCDWGYVGGEEEEEDDGEGGVGLSKFVEKLYEKGIREKNLKNALSGVCNNNFSKVPDFNEEEDEDEEEEGEQQQNRGGMRVERTLRVDEDEDEGFVDPELLYKIHLGLIETLETLEERVASASLQVKGWVLPSRNLMSENLSEEQIIEIVKERVLDLEGAVERRYLKPPLGKSGLEVNLAHLLKESEDVSYGLLLDGPIGSTSSTRGQQINENNKLKMELKERERIEKEIAARREKEEGGGGKGESRFLNHWRDAIQKTTSASVLSMAIYILDSSIAWDKSVMKASCQLCKGGDNEDKLLLCDACDRGYHTYCFKPPLENIPDGDWFCWECINKATGNKCCIVCGKGQVPNVKLLCCDKCVKAYHQDCIVPPVSKAPRGRWFCPDHRDGGMSGSGHHHHHHHNSSENKKVTLSQAVSVSMGNLSDGGKSEGDNGGKVSGNSCGGGEGGSSSKKKSASPKKKRGGSEKGGLFDGNISDSSNSSSFVVGNTTPHGSGSNVGVASESEPDVVVSKGRASTPVSSSANKKESSKKKKKGKKEQRKIVDNAEEDEVVGTGGLDEEECGGLGEVCGGGGSSSSPEKCDSPEKIVEKKLNSKKYKAEMGWCEKVLDDLVGHEDAWPFLEPVNTRQFPTYKKIIKTPMDLQTIRTRLLSGYYKNKEGFLQDVRLIFDNCETFNEDDSPVGKAGHTLRVFLESKPGVVLPGSSNNSGGSSSSSTPGGGGCSNNGK